jgi:RNAse (barnase) inhibitor barstar
MSKLLQRLSDATKSGVYRTSRTDEILDATRGSNVRAVRIELRGVAGKDELFDRISRALQFPEWFGRNWDALEDCLCDLSWSPATGHILLLECADSLKADERGILADVLATAASSWAERGRPFFAVFLDGPGTLPELYRNRK